MSRDEPRRRDWWLVGCAIFAVALAASTAAVVVYDEGIAQATFVAPGTPETTADPSHLLTRSTDTEPAAQPDSDGAPTPSPSR